jgi:hypothetical protein
MGWFNRNQIRVQLAALNGGSHEARAFVEDAEAREIGHAKKIHPSWFARTGARASLAPTRSRACQSVAVPERIPS